jgi:hypothetical protein
LPPSFIRHEYLGPYVAAFIVQPTGDLSAWHAAGSTLGDEAIRSDWPSTENTVLVS